MKNRVINRLTILTDLVLINLGFLLAYLARYEWQWLRPVTFSEPYSDYLGQQLLLTFMLVFAFYYVGVWRRRRLARAGATSSPARSMRRAMSARRHRPMP